MSIFELVSQSLPSELLLHLPGSRWFYHSVEVANTSFGFLRRVVLQILPSIPETAKPRRKFVQNRTNKIRS